MRFVALLAVLKLLGKESLLGFNCRHWWRTAARELVGGGEQSEVALEAISRNERKGRYRNFVTGREGVLRFQIRCLATALYCLHWLNLMGFFVEESGLIVTHLLYKAALVLAVLRWALAWALRFKNRTHLASPSNDSLQQSHPVPSSQQIRDGLILTTFGDVTERMPGVCDTCAVCLSQLRDQDEVRELRNCCHVFHRDCIDRWVDHDHEHDENHNTCPLCRAPLLTTSQSLARTRAEPSWAVERILYLFGDDLVM